MNIFDRLREKNSVIKWLVNFQKSIFYPIVFAAICIISSSNGINVYIPLVWLLASSVIFSALFTDDLKVFLVPFFMIYYAIGMDYEDSFIQTNGEILARFEPKALIHFVICGTIMVAFLIYKLIVSGAIKNILATRGVFLWGILALDFAFLLNGAFSPEWVPMDLVYGALNAAVLTLTYLIFLGIFRTCREDIVPYAAKTMVCFGYMVLTQVLALCYKLYLNNEFFSRNHLGEIIGVARINIFLSWGISTIIGSVVTLAIPSAFYLAYKHKFGIFFYISAFAFWGTAFMVNTRSAVLCGFVAIVISIVVCCKEGTNKKKNRILTGSFIALGMLAFAILIVKLDMSEIVKEILSIFRLGTGDGSGREELWGNGWNDFISSPVFGTGFANGAHSEEFVIENVYSNMYHNIIVQMLGAMGVVGLIAFIIHIISIVRVFFKKLSGEKIILMLTPLLILAMSLFDNFFFYPNFQIVYTAFLVCVETFFLKENNKT